MNERAKDFAMFCKSVFFHFFERYMSEEGERNSFLRLSVGIELIEYRGEA